MISPMIIKGEIIECFLMSYIAMYQAMNPLELVGLENFEVVVYFPGTELI